MAPTPPPWPRRFINAMPQTSDRFFVSWLLCMVVLGGFGFAGAGVWGVQAARSGTSRSSSNSMPLIHTCVPWSPADVGRR